MKSIKKITPLEIKRLAATKCTTLPSPKSGKTAMVKPPQTKNKMAPVIRYTATSLQSMNSTVKI